MDAAQRTVLAVWDSFVRFVDVFQYSPWGFLAFVVGLLGFLMAMPPLLQMIYAKPKIAMDFTKSTPRPPGPETIGMSINNEPITNKLLDGFGITRLTAEDVICHYTIWDAASGKEICKTFFPVVHVAAGEKAKRVSLPASRFKVFVPLGAVKDQKVYADTGDGKFQLLQVGRYKVRASVEYGNKHTFIFKYLVVRTSDPYGFWEVDS